uniref:Uncharacterized protein n=1 Tax=Ditylum brightwellii TaxID=49249 RepID=A0A7S4QYR0_9STRA
MEPSSCGRTRRNSVEYLLNALKPYFSGNDSESFVGDDRDSRSSCRQNYKEEQENFASDSPKNCPERRMSANFRFKSLTSYKFDSSRTICTDVSKGEIFPDENQNDYGDDCSSLQKKGSHKTNEFEKQDENKAASISTKQPGRWKRAQRRMGLAAPPRTEARNPAKSPIQKATTFFRRNGVVFNRRKGRFGGF